MPIDSGMLQSVEPAWKVISPQAYFFDAAAPIVSADSLDMTKVFRASRYDKGSDYLNCPMNEEEYNAFYDALVGAELAELHDFEKKLVFEGCLAVEILASRGRQTLAFGPLKPVGLIDPRTGKEPYAVVQLRQDNAAKSVFNLVGFQTHLKFGEQKRVFSMIPALKNAEFVRYGVMHRNTFLQSPKLLDRYYADRRNPLVAFAGQMTGVEGYVESTASGFLAAVAMAAKVQGREIPEFPKTTAIGALGLYVSDSSIENFQPMNINFGIMPALGYKVKGKRNTILKNFFTYFFPLNLAITTGSFLMFFKAFNKNAMNTEIKPAAKVTIIHNIPRLGPDFLSGTSANSKI